MSPTVGPWKGKSGPYCLREAVETAAELERRSGTAPTHFEIAEHIGYRKYPQAIDMTLKQARQPALTNRGPGWNREGALLTREKAARGEGRLRDVYAVTDLGVAFISRRQGSPPHRRPP